MKKIVFILLLTTHSLLCLASHITGGEMIYEYLGPGTTPNKKTYKITLRLFRDEHAINSAPMPTSVFIGIFNNDTKKQYPGDEDYFEVFLNGPDQPVSINPFPPCVTNAPDLDYHMGLYSLTVELPDNATGYTASYQTCCRVNPLSNVFTNNSVGGEGSTYSCEIPSVFDSSPSFQSSIDLICYNKQFTLNFSATDRDGDSLVYSFAEAYNGGQTIDARNFNPDPPPYGTVNYLPGFTKFTPLGDLAFINPSTGIISGVAPAAGKYVVCVSVKSYRKNVFVADHRKDFIVNVANCDLAGAQLLPKPVECNGFTVRFSNNNTSSLNKTFYWEFGDPKSGASNSSTDFSPTHTFSDSGTFVYKLIINKGEPCSDSASQTIKVYPGFYPGFVVTGQCKNTPIQFTDTTKTKYGFVNSWSWDFGDPQRTNDTSNLKNVSNIYTLSADYTVKFIVKNSLGCSATIDKLVSVKDKPDFRLTNDTLICTIDTLQLIGTGNGTFAWSPSYNISNVNAPSPFVSPDVPTKYFANFTDPFGCKGLDSVFVDVKNAVSLYAGNDTSICATDPVILQPNSDGLYFKWSPALSLDNDVIKNPVATPLTTTIYTVTASIGKCQNTDGLIIKVTPYPPADAGADTAICIGEIASLHAYGGSAYRWAPPFFLSDPNVPNPLANPRSDIAYVVSVTDTLGCPKAVSDTVLVRVINVIADAGPSDTVVVVNQPLQLNGTGGEFYEWAPTTGLNNGFVSNPVAHLSNDQQYILTVRDAGCIGIDTIKVRVYKIPADLYVPNAFTPGNDGINDVFRPIPIGMKSISYFKIYNRWGKLLFASSKNNYGWDGTYKGKPQDAAIYVWIAEGIDYQDKKITRKGSVMLVR